MYIDLKEYLRPVWEAGNVFREVFTMLREDGECKAPFLYRPDQILKVESYDGRITYEEGRDWYIENGNLCLTKESRIPSTDWSSIYFEKLEDAVREKEKLPPGFGIPVTGTSDGRYIRLFAVAHPWIIYKWQVAVSYTTGEKWEGYHPAPMLKNLPKLREKLKKKKPLKIVLYGDSISYGFDCTGIYELDPLQPKWIDMVCDSLRERFHVEIQLVNASESGQDSDWALKHAEELVVSEKPDLVLLGFGMNDRCPGDEYREKTKALVQTIGDKLQEAEFILIATSLPNELLDTEPMRFCAHQGEFAKALEPLCGEGCIMADIQDVQRIMMKRKRYIDLAGNNINHPNDYLARVYAQVTDTLLKE